MKKKEKTAEANIAEDVSDTYVLMAIDNTSIDKD